MNLSKKSALLISIFAIIIFWIYVFVVKSQSVPTVPDEFTDIVIKVVTNKFIYLAVIGFLLYLEGEPLKNLGFSNEKLGRQILMGMLFGVIIWVLVHIVVQPICGALFPNAPAKGGVDMSIHMKDLKNLLLWIPLVIFAGGFVEELERIFVLTRFEKWLGKSGLYLALILSSVAFGIGHLYQGFDKAVGTGFGGLLFGLVYLRKRSALEAMTCHAFFDIISVAVGYMIAQ